MSAVLFTNRPLGRKKSILAKVCFWCKKGLHVNVGKMNFYLRKPPLAPVLGLFAAKWSAFWCKTACVLVLNALRFGAKWSAFWC